MGNYITTTGIVGVIPSLTDPGPDYAQTVNNFLANNVAPHNHDGVNGGNLINIAGQIIQNDLDVDGYNLASIRGARFNSQSAVLSGTNDVNELSVINGDLYYNNSSGTPIQLSNGSQAVTLPFYNFTGVDLSNTNLTIPSNAAYNMINVSTSSASVTITLPLAAAVPAGRFFVIQDVGNNIYFGNPLAVQVPGGSGNNIYYEGVVVSPYGFTGNGQSTIFVSDGVSNWHTWNFQKNSYVFDTIVYTESNVDFLASNLNGDGYSSLLWDGYVYINAPTQPFVANVGAAEINANGGDIFLIGNTGVAGVFVESAGAQLGGPVIGNGSAPFQLGVLQKAPATSITLSGGDLAWPILYLTVGSLSANSTITFNTSAAGFWIINVGFVTFNSHHLTLQNSIGGITITSTPAGTPASNMLIMVANMGDATALWVSTTVIV